MQDSSVTIIIAIITLIGVLGAPYISRRLSGSRQDVIQSQGKSLADAFDEIRELRTELRSAEDKIDELKSDVRKFRNAYAKAIRYIYDKNPDEPIPDFLKDSDRMPKI